MSPEGWGVEQPGTESGPGLHLAVGGQGSTQASERPRLEFLTLHGAQPLVFAVEALLLAVADSSARQAGRRGPAPLTPAVATPQEGVCPQGREGQLLDWWPTHGVLEHGGSHGLGPRPRGKDGELKVGLWPRLGHYLPLPSSPSPPPQLWRPRRPHCLNHQFRKVEPQKHAGSFEPRSKNAPKEIVGLGAETELRDGRNLRSPPVGEGYKWINMYARHGRECYATCVRQRLTYTHSDEERCHDAL